MIELAETDGFNKIKKILNEENNINKNLERIVAKPQINSKYFQNIKFDNFEENITMNNQFLIEDKNSFLQENKETYDKTDKNSRASCVVFNEKKNIFPNNNVRFFSGNSIDLAPNDKFIPSPDLKNEIYEYDSSYINQLENENAKFGLISNNNSNYKNQKQILYHKQNEGQFHSNNINIYLNPFSGGIKIDKGNNSGNQDNTKLVKIKNESVSNSKHKKDSGVSNIRKKLDPNLIEVSIRNSQSKPNTHPMHDTSHNEMNFSNNSEIVNLGTCPNQDLTTTKDENFLFSVSGDNLTSKPTFPKKTNEDMKIDIGKSPEKMNFIQKENHSKQEPCYEVKNSINNFDVIRSSGQLFPVMDKNLDFTVEENENLENNKFFENQSNLDETNLNQINYLESSSKTKTNKYGQVNANFSIEFSKISHKNTNMNTNEGQYNITQKNNDQSKISHKNRVNETDLTNRNMVYSYISNKNNQEDKRIIPVQFQNQKSSNKSLFNAENQKPVSPIIQEIQYSQPPTKENNVFTAEINLFDNQNENVSIISNSNINQNLKPENNNNLISKQLNTEQNKDKKIKIKSIKVNDVGPKNKKAYGKKSKNFSDYSQENTKNNLNLTDLKVENACFPLNKKIKNSNNLRYSQKVTPLLTLSANQKEKSYLTDSQNSRNEKNSKSYLNKEFSNDKNEILLTDEHVNNIKLKSHLESIRQAPPQNIKINKSSNLDLGFSNFKVEIPNAKNKISLKSNQMSKKLDVIFSNTLNLRENQKKSQKQIYMCLDKIAESHEINEMEMKENLKNFNINESSIMKDTSSLLNFKP